MSNESEDFEFTKPVGIDVSDINLDDFDLSGRGSGFSGDIGNYGLTPDFLTELNANPDLLRAFQAEFPDEFNAIKDIINVGNLEEDFVVDDNGRVISTGNPSGEGPDNAGTAGARMSGSGESNITQRGGSSSTNPLARLLSGKGDLSDLLKTGLAGYMAKKAYDEGEAKRKAAMGWQSPGGMAKTATRGTSGGVTFKPTGKAAGGGIGSLEMARGGSTLPPRYLDGHSDGMADKVPAHIDNKRPAALSDGEFVIPADVVSHLGNGNSNAGAKRLYEMMDRIRAARTGNPKQGKKINPAKFMPR